MKTRKASSSIGRKQTQKRHSRTTRKNAITWTDPLARKHKSPRRKKTKLNKNDMKKNSCWWFG